MLQILMKSPASLNAVLYLSIVRDTELEAFRHSHQCCIKEGKQTVLKQALDFMCIDIV